MQPLNGSGGGGDPCDEQKAAAGLAQFKNLMHLRCHHLQSSVTCQLQFNPYKAQLKIYEAVI